MTALLGAVVAAVGLHAGGAGAIVSTGGRAATSVQHAVRAAAEGSNFCQPDDPSGSETPTDGPTSESQTPTDGPTSESQTPTDGPTSESQTPTDEPTSESQTPTDEPTSESQTPTNEPTSESQTPTDEPTSTDTQTPPDDPGSFTFAFIARADVSGDPTATDQVTALDDSYATPANTTLSVSDRRIVLDNDTGPEGAKLAACQLTDPAHGTAALNKDGTFTYVPVADFVGPDSFTYRAYCCEGESADATVHIDVYVPVPPPPIDTPTTPVPSTPASTTPETTTSEPTTPEPTTPVPSTPASTTPAATTSAPTKPPSTTPSGAPPTSDVPVAPIVNPDNPIQAPADEPTDQPPPDQPTIDEPADPSSTTPTTSTPTTSTPASTAPQRTLRLTAPSVIPGGPLRAAGTGCAPNSAVQLTIAGHPAGSGSSGADGHFDVPVTTTGLEVGTYSVTATCGNRQQVADVALVYVTANSTAPTAQALVVAVVLAFFLLLLGLVIRRPS